MKRLLKSTPPRSFPTGGMMMSFTSELTTAASATPMMNARANARTFALSNHSLNSDNIAQNLHAYVAQSNQHAGCQAHGRGSKRYRLDEGCRALLTFLALSRGEC